MKLLFFFEPEFIHHLTGLLIRILYKLIGRSGLRIAIGGPATAPTGKAPLLGLAAGFDKNAEWIRTLPSFGFQFAEIGTVTPKPQSGNDRPRLFRDPTTQSLFNRMGFNNLGATIVSERLAHHRPHLPVGFEVGINVGKNKNTPNELAAEDYALALTPFSGIVDYAVINVSSPNTAGLRDLQTLEALFPIVEAGQKTISSWKKSVPLYVKLAPEVSGETLRTLITGLEQKGVQGFILTNTLGGQHKYKGETYTGGWSGKAVANLALERLKEARGFTKKTLFSVGGIMSSEDAVQRIRAGADRVQIYSGWVYGGPQFTWKLRRKLDNTPLYPSNG